MGRMIVCRDCTESDCTYCNMNVLAVALERGYFNSLMREQHTVQIDSELVPVRHGHWQKSQIYPYAVVCSRCGTVFELGTSYCGECGAKMDERRKDDTCGSN